MERLRIRELCLVLGLAQRCFAQPDNSQRSCYYPNGDVIVADRACDSEAEHSACCGAPPWGAACMSNKLCKDQDGLLSRGSCTDPTWKSPACLAICLDPDLGAGHVAKPCPNVTTADTYCCHGASADCCDRGGPDRLTLGASLPYTWAEWVASSNGYYTVVTPISSSTKTKSSTTTTSSSSSSSSSSTTTTTTTTTDTPSRSSTGSSNISSPTTTPPTETTPPAGGSQQVQPPESSTPAASTSSQGLSTGAQAGIGVGAALGALLIAAAAFYLWKLHSKTKRLEEALTATQSAWGGGGQYPVHEVPGGQGVVKYELPPAHVAAYELGSPAGENYAELPGRPY